MQHYIDLIVFGHTGHNLPTVMGVVYLKRIGHCIWEDIAHRIAGQEHKDSGSLPSRAISGQDNMQY